VDFARSWNVLWTTEGIAHVWTINADGSFGGTFGMGAVGIPSGPSGYTAQSYSK
jgi:hypothetical protein